MVLLLWRVPLLHHCPCSERLESRTASVVGAGVWDVLAPRRARALGIGLLSGGYAHYRKRAIEAECSRTAASFVGLSPMGSIRGREMMILPTEIDSQGQLDPIRKPHYRNRHQKWKRNWDKQWIPRRGS